MTAAAGYETYGWRVTWLESASFAGGAPTEHSQTVEYQDDVFQLLRDIVKRKPVTSRPTYRPQVVELQRRVETREVPVGLGGWEC